MKPAVKPKNIGVAKTGLNLHLSPQLPMQAMLRYLLLKYHLQSHYILALTPHNKLKIKAKLYPQKNLISIPHKWILFGFYLNFKGKVDAAEFATADGLSDFEIVEGPIPFWGGGGNCVSIGWLWVSSRGFLRMHLILRWWWCHLPADRRRILMNLFQFKVFKNLKQRLQRRHNGIVFKCRDRHVF